MLHAVKRYSHDNPPKEFWIVEEVVVPGKHHVQWLGETYDTEAQALAAIREIGEAPMLDMTGTPRSDQDIEDAIQAVREVMVKQPLKIPTLTIHSGIILDCLKELQQRRKSDD